MSERPVFASGSSAHATKASRSGCFPGNRAVVATLTIVALVIIAGLLLRLARQTPGVALGGGFLVGGSLGNLVDRLVHGGVTDFIDPPAFPAFNVADIGITFGAVIVALSLLRAGGRECRRRPRRGGGRHRRLRASGYVVVGEIPQVGSRAEAQRLIAAGRVTVDGQPVANRTTFTPGQRIVIELAARAPSGLVPQVVPFEVRYEDEHLLVVDKPAGVVVHPARSRRPARCAGARRRAQSAAADSERPGIVHRLDRDTSGLLVVAQRDEPTARCRRRSGAARSTREYLALVEGEFAAAQRTVDAPLGRDRRHRTMVSTETDVRATRSPTSRSSARRSPSTACSWTPGDRAHPPDPAHLKAIGFPVVGDPVYGRGARLGLSRQFLHAARLAFEHPVTGVRSRSSVAAPGRPPTDALDAIAAGRR